MTKNYQARSNWSPLSASAAWATRRSPGRSANPSIIPPSSVISHLHPAAKTGHLAKGAIWLKVNGNTEQSSGLSNIIWSVAEQIANLSQFYEVAPDDIIYSGTPENVGQVVPGDVMEAHIDGIYDIRAKVV